MAGVTWDELVTELLLTPLGMASSNTRVALARKDPRLSKGILVRLRKGDLPAWTYHVDAETGDVIRIDTKSLVPGLGTLPRTITLEDYRDVQGLRIPFRVITEDLGNGRVIVQWEEIETGLTLAEDAFVFEPRER